MPINSCHSTAGALQVLVSLDRTNKHQKSREVSMDTPRYRSMVISTVQIWAWHWTTCRYLSGLQNAPLIKLFLQRQSFSAILQRARMKMKPCSILRLRRILERQSISAVIRKTVPVSLSTNFPRLRLSDRFILRMFIQDKWSMLKGNSKQLILHRLILLNLCRLWMRCSKGTIRKSLHVRIRSLCILMVRIMISLVIRELVARYR